MPNWLNELFIWIMDSRTAELASLTGKKSESHRTAVQTSLYLKQETEVTKTFPHLPLAAARVQVREATLADLDETVELFKTVYAEPNFNDSAQGFCLAMRMAE